MRIYLQIMPAGKGQLEKRSGLSILRYGGYNKLTGAYFCVVEHSEKGKRVRTIEPVYLYKLEEYENAPTEYCANTLKLVQPQIIQKEVRIDALMELNQKRLFVSSRTGDRIIMEHAYQLVLDSTQERLVKEIVLYDAQCKEQKRELSLPSKSRITEENLLQLYRAFAKKCTDGVYSGFFTSLEKHIRDSESKFIQMSMSSKCGVLLQIMNAFCSNALNADLKQLCGKGTVGRISISKNLSAQTSAYLIHQSVTGLYEYKTDLLKDC